VTSLRGAAAGVRLLVVGGLAVALAGCTGPATPGPAPAPAASTVAPAPAPSAAAGTANACDPRASLRPGALPRPEQLPAGSYQAAIRKRGRLIVGTSADTLLFSARNPFTGVIEGFDVDIARQVARAIFGDPDRLQIVVVPNASRIAAVMSGRVDLVAETMTITCDRLRMVAFSTVYYQAGQKVLVSRASTATGIDDLGGKRVCAAAGSTSLTAIRAARSRPVAVAAASQAECLVRFQQGTVDAISTDDTILLGLAAQDPYAKVVGSAFTDEPYGLAISREHPDFTRFVNAVLERARQDGTWATLYRRWLGQFGPAPAPPAARYQG